MDVLNWVLIHAGLATRWLGEVLASFLAAGWHMVDALLNPVLSPLLQFLNPASNFIGRAVYAPLAPLPIWLGLFVLSALAGVLMLLAFRATSNQEAIGRSKDAIKANLLALKLFKDDLRVTLRAQLRLVAAIGRLQWHMLKPMLLLLPPMLLVLAQMGVRYQWRPARPGEEIAVRVAVRPGVDDGGVRLLANEAVEVEVGPVPGGGEAWWRLRPLTPGDHALVFEAGDSQVRKLLRVEPGDRGEGTVALSALRPGHHWTAQLLHPLEARLGRATPIREIEILYPERESVITGAGYWLVSFFVVSMAMALVLAPVFRVRF